MSLLYDSERRHRRRMMSSFFRFAFFAVVLVVVSVISYRYGIREVESSEVDLTRQVAELTAENETLQRDAIRHQSDVRTVEIRYEELLRRFETEMPRGPLLDLTRLAAERLQEGVSPERLTFYLREAGEPRDCSALGGKRFVLPTPAYQGTDTSVSYEEGRISVTGLGENAVTANGGIQGWFDPARPVAVTFTMIGGETTSVEGLLPLYKSVVLDGQEYRFAIAAGRRSFVNVSADRCSFP
ncbi:MAG: hypothetical protein HKM95_11900 [Inquilinus sp.]|nr:hypothetical protein [Inquilinus sp.]